MTSIRRPAGTRRLRAAITAALGAALPLTQSTAQAPQRLSKEAVAARIDSMVRAYMAEKGPASMSVAISRGGETLVERAWGLADVAANRPATSATIYKFGSVSKQFTAVLLLKQVERGKLALTDSIGRYLTTGLRPEWRTLTIEQLLPGNRPAPKPFVGDAEALVGTYKGSMGTGPTTIQVAPGTEGLTISINGAAAQPLPWVEGLTFRQGNVLLTFRLANGGSGPVTELRYDTGTDHAILARS